MKKEDKMEACYLFEGSDDAVYAYLLTLGRREMRCFPTMSKRICLEVCEKALRKNNTLRVFERDLKESLKRSYTLSYFLKARSK